MSCNNHKKWNITHVLSLSLSSHPFFPNLYTLHLLTTLRTFFMIFLSLLCTPLRYTHSDTHVVLGEDGAFAQKMDVSLYALFFGFPKTHIPGQ